MPAIEAGGGARDTPGVTRPEVNLHLVVVMAVTHVPWLPMIDKDDRVDVAAAPQRGMAPRLLIDDGGTAS